MKLAPFLTGSNTPREEVIATSCFDSLVCGKAKTEEGALYRRRSRVTTGTHGNADAPPPPPLYFVCRLCQKLWERFPVSSPDVPLQQVLFALQCRAASLKTLKLRSRACRCGRLLFHSGVRGGVGKHGATRALTCTHGSKTCGLECLVPLC